MNRHLVNQQIVDVLSALQYAGSSHAIRAAGAGKAYQSVAQSAAIAVQDATDSLRNISTISITAMGIAITGLLETGESQYMDAINQANLMMTNAAAFFQQVGQSAAVIVDAFPSG